jgi:Tfp pilus assembly protein PilX
MAGNQQGFAAIIIAIVLLVVLSLITVGFAQLMRDNQRQALDKQLSQQAYYAAESGVNTATKAITAGFTSEKKDCGVLSDGDINALPADQRIGAAFLKSNQVGNSDTTFSCLLINPNPPTVEYGSVNNDQSKVTTITGGDPSTLADTPIGTIQINWQARDGGSTFADNSDYTANPTKLPPLADWTSATGVLRFSVTSLDSTSGAVGLTSKFAMQAFVYPINSSSDPVTYNYKAYLSNDSNGPILAGSCKADRKPLNCAVNITGLNTTSILVDLRSIYHDSKVSISVFRDSGGHASTVAADQLAIKHAQTLIDSTGKSQDVLRRIQVRLPVRDGYLHPDYSLEAGQNICKQIQVFPGSTADACPGQ